MNYEWTAYIQINGEETSDYYINEFEVSEEQYNDLVKAVENNIPVNTLGFYPELVKNAEATIDWEKLYLDEDWKPSKDDYYVPREDLEDIPEEYEDDDEYREELIFDEESYQEELESWKSSVDDYCLADLIIDDPGDLNRFKKKFIGRPLDNDETFDIDETDERIVYYHVNVSTEDGVIIDLDIEAEALESDGVKGGTLGECYPNYEFLSDELDEIIESYEN